MLGPSAVPATLHLHLDLQLHAEYCGQPTCYRQVQARVDGRTSCSGAAASPHHTRSTASAASAQLFKNTEQITDFSAPYLGSESSRALLWEAVLVSKLDAVLFYLHLIQLPAHAKLLQNSERIHSAVMLRSCYVAGCLATGLVLLLCLLLLCCCSQGRIAADAGTKAMIAVLVNRRY